MNFLVYIDYEINESYIDSITGVRHWYMRIHSHHHNL
jgi:hypothetical protein